MRFLPRILLACLLALCSPAWCACAFATCGDATASQSENVRGDDSCCPGETGQSGDNGGDTDGDNGRDLPCRDRSDCVCCDGAVIAAAVNVKDVTGSLMTLSMDLPLIPPFLASIALSAIDVATVLPSRDWSGAPPLPAETSSLLARRCLLLV